MEEMPAILQASAGILVFIALCWLISEDRSKFSWRLPAVGLLLQILFALAVFNIPFIQSALEGVNRGVEAVVRATESGTAFIFGYLGAQPGTVQYPFTVDDPGATMILAFRVLPLILTITVLSAILWHYRILPVVINGFAKLLRNSFGVSGAVGFSTAANIFVGMVEAPALVRPVLATMTRSELFIVMSAGMATVAGTVLVFYATVLQGILPNALGHILTASVMSAPAAIMFALIMVPATTEARVENDESHAAIRGQLEESKYFSLMDAITRGTGDGLRLMVNVGALLLVLVALVALVNALLSLLPQIGGEDVTLQALFAYLFSPLVWLMGVPWSEALDAGGIMGIKFVLNELLAFLALAEMPAAALSEKSTVILSYAICGFANFGSLGIMIGGLTAMCPQRSQEILSLAPKSLISGLLATCCTGAIAGILY